tara:strand:- start:335 stop:511 length:177 start_codon:yes stop_codon:yes gene_type:complete
MEPLSALLLIYFFFSVVIYNQMYKDTKRLEEDNRELKIRNKILQYDKDNPPAKYSDKK